jgi:hypothetical protein
VQIEIAATLERGRQVIAFARRRYFYGIGRAGILWRQGGVRRR